MPTQEDRIAALEQTTVSRIDFIDAMNRLTLQQAQMAMQVTMTRGLTEDAVKRLMQLRIQVDKRFNSTEQQLVEVKQELAEVKQELAEVKQDSRDHTTRLDRLETKVDAVQTTLAQILARLPEKP